MEKICVIVPVYKVEPYLRRCVESILAQTYSNFELILVDDGSPDASGEICDEYAKQDCRVHVIHQENGGLSAARNAGIDWMNEHSANQWLTFVDSDDWLHPRMLEVMLKAVQQTHTNIAVCGCVRTKGESVEVMDADMIPEVQAPEDYWQNNKIATIACAKLYAKHCFDCIRYPVGKVHEDEFTIYRVLFEETKIAVIRAPFYMYFINQDSITESVWSPRRMVAWEAIEEQLVFFQNAGNEKLYEFTLRKYLSTTISHYKELEAATNSGCYSKEKQIIEDKIKELLKKLWEHGWIRFWWDYEFLSKFYPVRTQLYRFFVSAKKVLGLPHESE